MGKKLGLGISLALPVIRQNDDISRLFSLLLDQLVMLLTRQFLALFLFVIFLFLIHII